MVGKIDRSEPLKISVRAQLQKEQAEPGEEEPERSPSGGQGKGQAGPGNAAPAACDPQPRARSSSQGGCAGAFCLHPGLARARRPHAPGFGDARPFYQPGRSSWTESSCWGRASGCGVRAHSALLWSAGKLRHPSRQAFGKIRRKKPRVFTLLNPTEDLKLDPSLTHPPQSHATQRRCSRDVGQPSCAQRPTQHPAQLPERGQRTAAAAKPEPKGNAQKHIRSCLLGSIFS